MKQLNLNRVLTPIGVQLWQRTVSVIFFIKIFKFTYVNFVHLNYKDPERQICISKFKHLLLNKVTS